MVLYVLSLRATLEHVASLKWDGAEKLLCCSIRHPVDPLDVKEKVVVDFSELEEQPKEDKLHHAKQHHNEKPCHFHVTWSDGSKGSIRIVQLNNHTDDICSNEWFPVLSLECENIEPTAFHPLGKEFIITNHHGKVYNHVDLSSGGWTKYDMSTGSTAITQLASKFA